MTTDQQQSLESATRELSHMRYALDQSAIVAITNRAGTIIHVNEKFCQISKYERSELLGKNHRIINSGYHSHEFFAEMWKTISSGKLWEGEIKNRAKDGGYYWVNTTIAPFLDEKGEPYQYVSVRYEITQRKLAEEQLRIYAERLESLLDSTFEGIIVHDSEGMIHDVNRVAAEVFGYDSAEMLGKHLSQFENIDGKEAFLNVSRSKDPMTLEALGVKKDGSTVHLEISGKPFQYQGLSLRLTAIRDITSRKQLEAQILMQDRLASVGLLASSLAHEIGTPLGVIRGRAEYLAIQTQDEPAIKKNVDVIIFQIDRVSTLIRALLNLARGDQTRVAGKVLLNHIVEEVVDLMGHELRRYSISTENHLHAEVPIAVRAESQPLHQVLLNLLVNSVHAIDSAVKAGRVSGHYIRLSSQEVDGNWVLSVEDSGCGISEESLKHLFKPFFTTKEIGVGTGLGLVTSYRIIESWGGKIQVQSQEGLGSTFKVFLPKVENS